MIPSRISLRILCDGCGSSSSVFLDEDAIDRTGWDMAIEEALTDAGWGCSERLTFCTHCMDKALNLALQTLARDAERSQLHDSKAVLEVSV